MLFVLKAISRATVLDSLQGGWETHSVELVWLFGVARTLLVISIAIPNLFWLVSAIDRPFLSFFKTQVDDVSYNQHMAEFLLKIQFGNLSFLSNI